MVVVRGDSSDVLDFLLSFDWDCLLFKTFYYFLHSCLNAAAEVHWVHARSDRFAAFFEDGASEDSRGGGAVTSHIVNFTSDLFDEGGANVVVAVGELDIFRDGHTVFSNLGSTESAIKHNVATTRSKRNLNRVSKAVTPFKHKSASLSTKLDILSEGTLRLTNDSFLSHDVFNGLHSCDCFLYEFKRFY